MTRFVLAENLVQNDEPCHFKGFRHVSTDVQADVHEVAVLIARSGAVAATARTVTPASTLRIRLQVELSCF